jgi:hypothetical protein
LEKVLLSILVVMITLPSQQEMLVAASLVPQLLSNKQVFVRLLVQRKKT